MGGVQGPAAARLRLSEQDVANSQLCRRVQHKGPQSGFLIMCRGLELSLVLCAAIFLRLGLTFRCGLMLTNDRFRSERSGESIKLFEQCFRLPRLFRYRILMI